MICFLSSVDTRSSARAGAGGGGRCVCRGRGRAAWRRRRRSSGPPAAPCMHRCSPHACVGAWVRALRLWRARLGVRAARRARRPARTVEVLRLVVQLVRRLAARGGGPALCEGRWARSGRRVRGRRAGEGRAAHPGPPGRAADRDSRFRCVSTSIPARRACGRGGAGARGFLGAGGGGRPGPRRPGAPPRRYICGLPAATSLLAGIRPPRRLPHAPRPPRSRPPHPCAAPTSAASSGSPRGPSRHRRSCSWWLAGEGGGAEGAGLGGAEGCRGGGEEGRGGGVERWSAAAARRAFGGGSAGAAVRRAGGRQAAACAPRCPPAARGPRNKFTLDGAAAWRAAARGRGRARGPHRPRQPRAGGERCVGRLGHCAGGGRPTRAATRGRRGRRGRINAADAGGRCWRGTRGRAWASLAGGERGSQGACGPAAGRPDVHAGEAGTAYEGMCSGENCRRGARRSLLGRVARRAQAGAAGAQRGRGAAARCKNTERQKGRALGGARKHTQQGAGSRAGRGGGGGAGLRGPPRGGPGGGGGGGAAY
jgi:hypothetical protein